VFSRVGCKKVYIRDDVLNRLLTHPKAASYNYTAFVKVSREVLQYSSVFIQ